MQQLMHLRVSYGLTIHYRSELQLSIQTVLSCLRIARDTVDSEITRNYQKSQQSNLITADTWFVVNADI